MTERKNLKVSAVTHEYILNNQRPAETMDETLQRMLGIGPDPDDLSQTMAAYLPDEMQAQVGELVAHIEGLGSFRKEYETDGGRRGGDVIRFVDTSTGITIAQLEMSEQSYGVQYRDASGEMRWTDHGEIVQSQDVDLREVKEAVRTAIEGARRRWAE